MLGRPDVDDPRAASCARCSRGRRRWTTPGRELIAAANDAGGRDNITVVLFRLEEVDARASARPAAAAAADEETSEYDTFEGEAGGRRARGTRADAETRGDDALRSTRRRRGRGRQPRTAEVGDRRASRRRRRRSRRRGTAAAPRSRREGHPRAPRRCRGAPPPGRRRASAVARPALVVVLVLSSPIVLGGVWIAIRAVFFVGPTRAATP